MMNAGHSFSRDLSTRTAAWEFPAIQHASVDLRGNQGKIWQVHDMYI